MSDCDNYADYNQVIIHYTLLDVSVIGSMDEA